MFSHTCSIGEKSRDLNWQYVNTQHVRLILRYEGEPYPVGNTHLNAVHEWKQNRFNNQVDVQFEVSVRGIITRVLLLPYEIAAQQITPAVGPAILAEDKLVEGALLAST